MTGSTRWMKFTLLGAMGMALQLASLAVFNRWMSGRYLYASIAAVELALLHNFAWHLHFTWRDRRDGALRRPRLVSCHLSNGLISIVGNFALMWFLAHAAHLPIIFSNFIAIICCSISDFILRNKWAFAEPCQVVSTSTP